MSNGMEFLGIEEGFWCREDLDYFMSELEDRPEIKANNITVKGVWMEKDRFLQVEVSDGEFDWIEIEKIDQRKIKRVPYDLVDKYMDTIVEKILRDKA